MEKQTKKYDIIIKKSVRKSLNKVPKKIIDIFEKLVEQLKDNGPVAYKWSNYSKLGKNKYHCHLTYSYVACWTCENESIEIEVYYVGNREKAPY